MIRLTDKEAEIIFETSHRDNGRKEIFREIAKAQLKKVVEWGDESCEEHAVNQGTRKRDCPFCWQVLLEETK